MSATTVPVGPIFTAAPVLGSQVPIRGVVLAVLSTKYTNPLIGLTPMADES